MSDTPRTDEETMTRENGAKDYEYVDAEFARQLERELNAANERIKRLAQIGSRFVNADDLTEYIATEHAWIEEVKDIPK